MFPLVATWIFSPYKTRIELFKLCIYVCICFVNENHVGQLKGWSTKTDYDIVVEPVRGKGLPFPTNP
jgi:hypothetical protein